MSDVFTLRHEKIFSISISVFYYYFWFGDFMLKCELGICRRLFNIQSKTSSSYISIIRFGSVWLESECDKSCLSPTSIRRIGTIAIVGAYNDPNIEADLGVFDAQFNLPACTIKNKCLTKHLMKSNTSSDAGWALETSMDIEWAHAIARNTRILLVEAASDSGTNLLSAVDYARNQSDVVAVSMSWGGPEFKTEASKESYFVSKYGATFFASSGDNGAGASWPAVSAHVVAVGGTHLTFDASKNFISESAWSGSGGGISKYIKEPIYQSSYSIPNAQGMRAVPDVSYNANPVSGFSVYDSYGYNSQKGWFTLGGTSAGAPQWAAIRALGFAGTFATNARFYADKATDANSLFFRDIVSGSNGSCTYFCTARKRYDYVTGLGSPLTVKF